jgi:hypothetical protein
MSKQTGISHDTYKRLMIDSGAVYKNFVNASNLGTLIGATRGGNVFKVESDIREMPVDGAHGPVKGSKRLLGVKASIEANFIELTKEIIQFGLPGSDLDAVSTTHNKATRDREITGSDYISSIAIVGNVTGSTNYVICVIKNAMSDGKFDMSFKDKEEGVIKANFEAHFDVDDLTTEPWEIHWPVISSASTSTSSSASSSASASASAS